MDEEILPTFARSVSIAYNGSRGQNTGLRRGDLTGDSRSQLQIHHFPASGLVRPWSLLRGEALKHIGLGT